MKFLFNNFLLGNIQRNSTPYFFLQNWVQIFFRMLECHLAYFIKINFVWNKMAAASFGPKCSS